MGDEETEAPRSTRDAAEIRGRIALSFSVLELRRLAEELGVTDIAWERGMTESARDMVRHFERQGRLGALVERLREARPLLEWPDPWTLPPSSSGRSPASVIVPVPAVPRPSRPSAGASPATDPSRSVGFPGNVEPEAPRPPRRVDLRILLVASGAVGVALGIAFAAGRATNRAASVAGSLDASPAPGPAGLTDLATAAIERRIEAVSRLCEIPPGAADDVMRRAFERCGPAPEAAAPLRPAESGRLSRPAVTDLRSRPSPAAPRPPVVAGNAGCLSSCEQRHRTCIRSECGSEPTQGSQYKRYQDCLSTCLQQASKCRLGCP